MDKQIKKEVKWGNWICNSHLMKK